MSIMFRPRGGVNWGTVGEELVVVGSDPELWRLDRINLPLWQSIIHQRRGIIGGVNQATVGTEVVVIIGDQELPRVPRWH